MQAQTRKKEILPRGLNKTHAAGYVGVSANLFERMIQQGLMPDSLQAARYGTFSNWIEPLMICPMSTGKLWITQKAHSLISFSKA